MAEQEQQQQGSKKQRTIQVKIGNQAGRAMTPDQAADYLKRVGWGQQRELKLTFDNGSTSTVSLSNSKSSESSPRSDGLPCSEKEMKALMSMFVEVMGLQMNTDRLNKAELVQQNSSGSDGRSLFQFPDDIPPPPGGWPDDLLWPQEEGDDDGNNEVLSVDSLPILEDIPNNERPLMIQRQKSRVAEIKRQQQVYKPFPPVPGSKHVEDKSVAPVIRSEGIAPFEWSALERSAIEDALEQEERIRKAPTSSASSTSSSKKKQAHQPSLVNSLKKPPVISQKDATAALKKVEVANKKLGKAVITWRNRLTSAINQNEVDRVSRLLNDSPLPAVIHLHQQAASALSQQDAVVNQDSLSNRQYWEELMPLCVPKSRSLKGGESRNILTKYLLFEQGPNCMFSIGRSGRSCVHTACLYGDISTLKLIFAEARKVLSSEAFEDLLLEPCQDSGWTPLHYAAASGNLKMVETILSASCDDDTVKILCCATTNSMQTWKRGANKGITPAFLAETIVSGKSDKFIETHGMALQDCLDYNKATSNSSSNSNLYMHLTGFIYARLLFVEESTTFVELSDHDLEFVVSEFKDKLDSQKKSAASIASSTTTEAARVSVDTDDDSSAEEKRQTKKKKKKRKKKKQVTPSENLPLTGLPEQNTPNRRNLDPSVSSKDPLINALEGMGFEHEKVLQGIAACGGSSRATADDVVAWIFGAGTATEETEPTLASNLPEDQFSQTKTRGPSRSISKEEAEKRNAEAAKQKEEERLAAEKMAAKREEQRRRNREWNNRAQARQAMEAQDRLSKTTSMRMRQPVMGTGLRTGVVANPSLTSGVRGAGVPGAATAFSNQTYNATTQKVTRIETNPARREASSGSGYFGGNQGPQRSESGGIDKALSNDASTVASSLGPTMFEVEISQNDDATVSTMGSFPAVPQSNFAPPGFDSDGLPASESLNREAANSSRWDPSQRSSSFGDVHGTPHGFSSFNGGQMGPPPGIPESGPLMDRPVELGNRSQSFTIAPTTRHVPIPSSSQSQHVVSNGSTQFTPTTGMLDLSMRSSENNHVPRDTRGSLLDSGLPVAPPSTRVGIGPHEFGGNDPSQISGLLGFGTSLNPRAPLDSAIIDSISTSNTGLGMSDLWSDTKMGSSLLDTLLEKPTESMPGIMPNSGFFTAAEESLHSTEQKAPVWQQGISRSHSVSSTGGTGVPPNGSIW